MSAKDNHCHKGKGRRGEGRPQPVEIVEKKQSTVRARIPTLPVLNYVNEVSSNWVQWEKDMKTYALRECGDAAGCMKTGKPVVPDPVVYDRDRFKEDEAYREQIKQRIRINSTNEESIRLNTQKLYAILTSQLSAESEEVIKETDDWEDIESKSDACALWNRIKETHLAPSSGIDLLDRRKARTDYNSLFQRSGETVQDFKDRFDRAIQALLAVHERVPDVKDQAVDFIEKLDNKRFALMKSELSNDAMKDKDSYPAQGYEDKFEWSVICADLSSVCNHS